MGRLIDADELVNWLKSCAPPDGKVTMGALLAAIGSRPTVDAAPVVRCRDCKYWKECGWVGAGPNTIGIEQGGKCRVVGHIVLESDFCSLGQRRETPNAQ
jgi:hypothetical protein